MRVAIPVSQGKLAAHFGHCEQFVLCDLDPDTKSIVKTESLTPPAHEPGVLPAWLAEQGAQVILAGGMGSRAQQLFADHGVKVIVGAPELDPETLALQYLAGEIGPGQNACDH